MRALGKRKIQEKMVVNWRCKLIPYMNQLIKHHMDCWSIVIQIAQNIIAGLLCITYFRVLSKLPVTKSCNSEIQAISLMGPSCAATVIVWLVAKDHILACLSQPPEKTVAPSSFQAEHKAYIDNHILLFIRSLKS